MPDSFPLPPVHDELSRHFYAAAGEGRLLAQRCRTCDRLQFYPRHRCRHCHSDDVVWHQVSGRGVVHTFTVIHLTPNPEFAADCPYVLAIVELEEGVRMSGRVVDIAAEDVRCELPVEVRFERRGELTVPWFGPRAAG